MKSSKTKGFTAFTIATTCLLIITLFTSIAIAQSEIPILSASASSSSQSSQNTIDNDLSTFWQGKPKDVAPWWIKFDLGQSCDLAIISIWWDYTRGSTNYAIQTSLNGTDWSDVYTNLSSAGGSENPYLQSYPLSSPARYVRIYINQEQKLSPRIYEVKLYGLSVGDTTPPTTPVVTDDGESTLLTSQLHATWSSSDPESGIAEYQYKIIQGSPIGTTIVDWTSTGTTPEVTKTGLNLIDGKTYYFGIKARNGADLWSDIGYSDGITIPLEILILSASASSSSYPSQNTIDNDLSTFWEGERKEGSWWIELDLGRTYDLAMISIWWHRTRGSTNYAIQTSLNGTDWSDVYTNLSSAGGSENPYLQSYPLSSPARYVRIYINQEQKLSPRIYEVKLYVPPNRPPVLDPIGNKTVDEGQALSFVITASDPDYDSLTYSAANLPTSANFNGVTHAFTWTPQVGRAGTYSGVHFEVSDGSLIDSEDITITVNDVNPPDQPTVDPVTSPTNAETQTITGTKSEDTAKIIITSLQATVGSLSYPTSTNWSCSATLQEGNNAFSVIAEDGAGNQSSPPVEFVISLDTIPPEIIITSPEDGAVVTTQDITLEGTVDGEFFSEPRSLQPGDNVLTKQATDEAGNTSEASINVHYYIPQTVGPEGGTVTSQNGDVVVEVPEGALDTPQEISAIDKDEEDFQDTQLPPDTEVIGALEVLPTGITFQQPVKLNIPLETPHIPGTPVKIGLLNESTNTFEDTGKTSSVNADSYTVTTEVDHFSTYAALKGMVSAGAPIGGGVDIPTPDLFTGAFTHNIVLEIPKGRKDMHPNLLLQYRSSNPNSWVGFGWQLNPGYIQRSTKGGPPTYNDGEDTFVFVSQSQSTELVHLVDNLYQAKIEGVFVKYYKQTDDTWYLLTKDGNRMYLGQTPNSKQTTSKGTFAWYLTEAIDPNGNYIEFNYVKDQGKVYLDNILYTGNENTGVSPNYEVRFYLEDRTDISSSHISGEECTMGKRLDYIEVFCNYGPTWTYEFEYTYSLDTARSLLTSIRQIGSDGITSYPAQTFEYQRKE